MRAMLIIIVLGLAGIAGFLYYKVQTVTHDPAVWHVDPLTVPPSPTPNSYRVAPPEFTEYPVGRPAPIYAADARTVAAAFDKFVMKQPRVQRVAGSVNEGWITYVQRTEVLHMPDYISVRFYDLETGTPQAPAEPETVQQMLDQPGEEGAGSDTGTDTAANDQANDTQATDAADANAGGDAAPAKPAEPRSTIAIYSRSRFGYGDMGVNEARVNAWLASIDSFKVEQ